MALPRRFTTHRSLREFDLIHAIRRRYGAVDASIVQGIGDDAAIVAPRPRESTLLTTDLLTEGVHFDLRTAAFTEVGFRAVVANLSDIAAMGGVPRYLLAALAIPYHGTGPQVRQLYDGMMAAARPHGVRLIGGDMSASTGGWFISIALMGVIPSGQALLRSGARVGDGIYVTGTLGDALAGLAMLRESTGRSRRRHGTTSLSSHHRRFLMKRHRRPTARLEIGRWLSRNRLASSAIDLSDGLSGDLRHICEASRVGAEIETAALPVSPACRAFAGARHVDPSDLALTGGEDYELLFTAPAHLRTKLEKMAGRQGFHLTRVGTIRPARSGIQAIRRNGRRHPLAMTSYEHFGPSDTR